MSIEKPEAIRVVCLDWGGVLLRICRSWEEACTAAGLALPGEPVSEGIRRKRRELSEHYQLGRMHCDAYFQAVADLSPGYASSDIRRLHDAYLIDEYHGALQLAQELAGHARVRGALLSNTNHSHWLRQSDFTAAATLPHRVASYQQGLAKPEPKFYEALEAAVGARAEQIAFFDDLQPNIDAARAMGWQAVRVDPDGDTIAQVRTALSGVL